MDNNLDFRKEGTFWDIMRSRGRLGRVKKSDICRVIGHENPTKNFPIGLCAKILTSLPLRKLILEVI